MIPHGQIGKQIVYVIPCHKTCRHIKTRFTRKSQGKQILFSRFLLIKRQIIPGNLITQKHGPVLHPYQTIQRLCIITYRIQAANNCPHTGTGNIIYRYARFLQHFQYPYVRDSFCTTATQH